ncbi:MAG TPA: prepilin peptidase [Clostridiaceae bacterium]|nr:prepilin peptidase [Clostridiaceae bacterium]
MNNNIYTVNFTTANIAVVILIFIAGLFVGSFLNICIYSIPRNQSIVDSIKHLITRNRNCKFYTECRIRSILVELLTGLTYMLLYLKYGLSIDFFACIYIMGILLVVLFIDIDKKIIPDKLVLAGLAGGFFLFIYNLFQPVIIFGDRKWWNPILGAVTGSGILFLTSLTALLFYKTDQAIGMGDVKIFIPIGFFLGWKMTIVALLVSIFLGGFTSFILIIFRVKNRKSTIAFGPFIVTGTFVTLLWGWDILKWYLGILF